MKVQEYLDKDAEILEGGGDDTLDHLDEAKPDAPVQDKDDQVYKGGRSMTGATALKLLRQQCKTDFQVGMKILTQMKHIQLDCRRIFTVGFPFWLEHGQRIKDTITPDACLQAAVKAAMGSWIDTARLVFGLLTNPDALHYLGLTGTLPSSLKGNWT